VKLLHLSFGLLAACAVRGAPPIEGPPTPVVILEPQPAASAAPPALPSVASAKGGAAHDYFTVQLEQHGEPVPIQDHEALLAKRPFDIIVTFDSWPDSVSVNVSASPRWFDAARAGASFDVGDVKVDPRTGKYPLAPFAMGHGLAEAEHNPDPELFVNDDGAHLWDYENDKSNRCSVATIQGRGVVCRRHVERLGIGSPMSEVDLSAWAGGALYLVFLGVTDGTEAKNWADRVERQRLYLKVKLR
jgi:hypothetical protein